MHILEQIGRQVDGLVRQDPGDKRVYERRITPSQQLIVFHHVPELSSKQKISQSC